MDRAEAKRRRRILGLSTTEPYPTLQFAKDAGMEVHDMRMLLYSWRNAGLVEWVAQGQGRVGWILTAEGARQLTQ